VFGPALLGVGTKAAIEDPATSVADDPAVPASVVVAGEGNANRGSAHAYVAHAGPTRETIIAALEGSPAAVPDGAAVVVATGRNAGLHRFAVAFGVMAQPVKAILREWTGSLAFQGAAAAVADLATDDRAVVTGVGFANRGWPHAHVVDALPAGFRAITTVEGAATAIADGSAVLATAVLAGHRCATWRGADPRAGALPAAGAGAAFQGSTAAVADPSAVLGFLLRACPADSDRVGGRVHGAAGVRNHRAVVVAVRCENDVGAISDPACVADLARPGIVAPAGRLRKGE
jgi:hypothetical protein